MTLLESHKPTECAASQGLDGGAIRLSDYDKRITGLELNKAKGPSRSGTHKVSFCLRWSRTPWKRGSVAEPRLGEKGGRVGWCPSLMSKKDQ